MNKYSVILRYEVEVEIPKIEAANEQQAINAAKNEVEGNLEHYISDTRFKQFIDVQELEEDDEQE